MRESNINIDTIDTITSKSSTLPYDDDTMQKMIELVRNAKSTPVCCREKEKQDR